MFSSKSAIVVSAVLAILVPFTYVTAESSDDTQPAQVPNEAIYVVKADSNSGNTILGGTVLPHKMVKLLTQMPGEVTSIAGREGDSFKTGDVLVAQDTAALMAKRQAAIAGLNSAKAGLGNARVQYNNELYTPNSRSNGMLGGAPGMFSMFSDPMRSMAGQGSPGYERHANLYGQNTQVRAAEGQVQQAMAGITELDANIRNAITTAPFDGVIIKKMVEQGDVVQPGMPLMVFADISKMELQVEVPERLVANIQQGSKVNARLSRDGELVAVTVSRVFPMANTGGHTTTVKFALPAGTSARAGMYAEVLIPSATKTSSALPSIPESAITWRGSLPGVFVVSDDRTHLKMKTLRLGSSGANGMVSVLSGIKVGDQLIKTPTGSTRSGAYTPVN